MLKCYRRIGYDHLALVHACSRFSLTYGVHFLRIVSGAIEARSCVGRADVVRGFLEVEF